jgi:hypothetical protein
MAHQPRRPGALSVAFRHNWAGLTATGAASLGDPGHVLLSPHESVARGVSLACRRPERQRRFGVTLPGPPHPRENGPAVPHLVFSFGTLRDAAVQEALLGRRLSSSADALVGYRVGRVRISDPAAIAASGADVHPALVQTGRLADVVEGELLELTDDELSVVHRYEEVSFMPINVETRGGRTAIAYCPKPELPLEP